jgi:hypothetical protein
MRPGAAGFRGWLVFAFCSPWPHVMRLRPGRPRMRTLRGHLCGADALSTSSGANRRSFGLGGANPAHPTSRAQPQADDGKLCSPPTPQKTIPHPPGGVPAPVYREQGLSRGFRAVRRCEWSIRSGFTRSGWAGLGWGLELWLAAGLLLRRSLARCPLPAARCPLPAARARRLRLDA